MKKTAYLTMLLFAIATTFTSCDVSYFDSDIEDFVWDGGLKAPVGHATYTLSELFDELEVSSLDEDANGNLSFSYTESISGGNETAFDVEINDVTINSSVATPVTASDISPATFPITLPDPVPGPLAGGKAQNNQVVYDLALSQDLTGAELSSGTMTISFNSTFDAAISLTMDIPTFKKKTDDSPYSGTVNFTGAGTQQLVVLLNDYNADFTNDGSGFDNTVNSVVLNMSATFTFAPGNVLTASDQISYSAVLTGAGTDVVYGDFKQEAFSVDNNTIDLDFFEDFGDGGIAFENASMTISASNGFGFPIGIDVSGISGDTGAGTPATALTYTSTDADELAAGSDYMIFDGISTYTAGAASVVTTTTLDNTNSNINALLSSKPTRFNLNVAGMANPVSGGTNENFYSATNNGLSVDVTVDVPLDVKFTDVKISQDDIELDLGDDIDDLNNILLKVATINEIPLSGTINLIFKENGNLLGLTKSIPVFEAAPTDNTGKSNGSTTSSAELQFNDAEMELLKQATDVGLDITFNSGTNAVKLNGNDKIKLILSADIALEIAPDEEENN
ncbi:hypothetical protein [Flavicella marina]|uniref:hypothetical protein n=1 Tax=Flavicella marina TaxID=1475951 RepID=UPI0012641A70|nr:hypothetical protein [Flavicella marina]